MTSKYFEVPFANAGDKTTIPNDPQPSGSVSFTEGYTPDYEKDQATDPDAKDVPRQGENYLNFAMTEALKEFQEIGGKPYDDVVNYPSGAVIIGSDDIFYNCVTKNGPGASFLPVVDPVGDTTGTWILHTIKDIENIDDLRLVIPSQMNGKTVTVLGYTDKSENRNWKFIFNSSDLSTEVTKDTKMGIYAPPSSDLTGSSGAWVRVYDTTLYSSWFGSIGDGSDHGTDEVDGINACINMAKRSDEVILDVTNGGFYLTSGIDVRGRKVRLKGFLRTLNLFTGTLMDDGTTQKAMVYISGGPAGADDGAAFTGSHKSSSYDIDGGGAADTGGGASGNAEHCILINNTHHYDVSDLLCRGASRSNVGIFGMGFTVGLTRMYSAHSAIGYEYENTGVQGNGSLKNCYSVFCNTGFYFHNNFSTVLNACAADQCDLGIRSRSNGRITLNGWNSEITKELYWGNDALLIMNNAVITNAGTLATLCPNPTLTAAGLFIFRLDNCDLTLDGIEMTADFSTAVEKIIGIETSETSRITMNNTWANRPTLPAKSIVSFYAKESEGAALGTGISPSTYQTINLLDTECITQYTTNSTETIIVGGLVLTPTILDTQLIADELGIMGKYINNFFQFPMGGIYEISLKAVSSGASPGVGFKIVITRGDTVDTTPTNTAIAGIASAIYDGQGDDPVVNVETTIRALDGKSGFRIQLYGVGGSSTLEDGEPNVLLTVKRIGSYRNPLFL